MPQGRFPRMRPLALSGLRGGGKLEPGCSEVVRLPPHPSPLPRGTRGRGSPRRHAHRLVARTSAAHPGLRRSARGRASPCRKEDSPGCGLWPCPGYGAALRPRRTRRAQLAALARPLHASRKRSAASCALRGMRRFCGSGLARKKIPPQRKIRSQPRLLVQCAIKVAGAWAGAAGHRAISARPSAPCGSPPRRCRPPRTRPSPAAPLPRACSRAAGAR